VRPVCATPATYTSEIVNVLIEDELSRLADQRLIAHIRSLLTTPEIQMREWDYGEPGKAYPCWLVMAHASSNTAVAYCTYGFGPGMPWGLLRLRGTEQMSMGMDSSWLDCFLDAYFDSQVAADLPIWRVFQRSGNDYPGIPITVEDSWESTWSEVMRLIDERPAFRYVCWQSVYVRASRQMKV
jgi:hypothetical protein